MGIGVAMYPVVSNAVAQRHVSSVIESYTDTVRSMDAEKIDAAKQVARRYNQQLNNALDRDAAGEGADTGTSYVDMLDVGESMGYITSTTTRTSLICTSTTPPATPPSWQARPVMIAATNS